MRRTYTDREEWLIQVALESDHNWSARGIARVVFAPRGPDWIKFRPSDGEVQKVYSVARSLEIRLRDARNGDTEHSLKIMSRFRNKTPRMRLKVS